MQSAINLAFAFVRRSRVKEAVRFTGSNLMRGTYPRDTKNGSIFVVAEVFALLENLAIGKHFT